jgi:hypothetical protein
MTGFSLTLTVVCIIVALFGTWAMREAERLRKRMIRDLETAAIVRRARQHLQWRGM